MNYYLVANAYPFLKELLKDTPGKDFFATNRWRRIEKLRGKKADEYALALHQLLALHAEKLDDSNSIQRAVARKMNSTPIGFSDEDVAVDNLFCPACKEPTAAIFFGVVPGEGPDGEEMYPYHAFRCRFCRLELDDTQIQYLAKYRQEFDLTDKKDEVHAWTIATGLRTPAEDFRDTSELGF